MNVYESPEDRKRRLERERRDSNYNAPVYDYSSAFDSGSCNDSSSGSSDSDSSSSCSSD